MARIRCSTARVGRDREAVASIAIHAAAIPVAIRYPWLSQAGWVFVALLWLVPERRIEKAVAAREQKRRG